MGMSWREAIEKVLVEAEGPLHYAEISEQILSRGYYKPDGATPAATVNSQISSSIKHDGDKSPFVRVGRGIFSLRANVVSQTPIAPPPSRQRAEELPSEAENNEPESIIRSFGMYWQRDLVVWKSDPKMFGKQQALIKPVDFGRQKGIYILYDHHTVVYVGRAIDRPLGKRLYEHTIDRLGSRWTRFSWFGLLDVTIEATHLHPRRLCQRVFRLRSHADAGEANRQANTPNVNSHQRYFITKSIQWTEPGKKLLSSITGTLSNGFKLNSNAFSRCPGRVDFSDT